PASSVDSAATQQGGPPSMPTDTIQPIQEILNRWILIGQALVGSIGALTFVVAFLWTKIGRFKAQTCVWDVLTS
ncbi:MAG TPA: hypothetical protein VKI99_18295, partial [Candidatus Dormibacteraeota bacterium]|nr:hypothetical protein [Candidatus Dormibacteraeota bacterium]